MADFLSATTETPIADLSPILPEASTRSIRAIVTLIWPYSSSNSSLTVLLAEPDFRLRRNRGQVRVQFWGSSAKNVFETGIGSGDEVILSLRDAEWIESKSVNWTPGHGIDWELKFTEKLLVKILESETRRVSLLDVNHPENRPTPEPVSAISVNNTANAPPSSDPVVSEPHESIIFRSDTSEWSSPAFIKRARISYGSLLDSGVDIFASDDGTIQGRGRKRTRFSRQSNGWRYSSQLPSPEREDFESESVGDDSTRDIVEKKPLITDEGCQTQDLDDDHAIEVLEASPWQGMSARNTVMSLGEDTLSFVAQDAVQGESVVPVPMTDPANSLPISKLFSTNSDMRVQDTIQSQDRDANSIPPTSLQLQPVLPDALPLVSPLGSRELGTGHESLKLQTEQRMSSIEENLDACLLGPESLIPLQSGLRTEEVAVSPIDTEQSRKMINILQKGPVDQDNKDSTLATHDQSNRSHSPQSSMEHIALEHYHHNQEPNFGQGNRASSTLEYLANDIQIHPNIDKNLPSSLAKKPYQGFKRSEPPFGVSSIEPLYPSMDPETSIVMSRSQDAHSEALRLTENWNAEKEGEMKFDSSKFGINSIKHRLDPDRNDTLQQNNGDTAEVFAFDESQDDDECGDGDEEDRKRPSVGFPVNYVESNEWGDDGMDPWENRGEHDGDYNKSEEELAPTIMELPAKTSPEIIILLSSDDEESGYDGNVKGSEDGKGYEGSMDRVSPKYMNDLGEPLTRDPVYNDFSNNLREDESDENDFGDGEYSDQDYDDDIESSVSRAEDFQDFQEESAFVHRVEMEMLDTEDSGTEATDSSDISISPLYERLKDFDGDRHFEVEIEVNRSSKTCQSLDHSPVQNELDCKILSDNSKRSPPDDQISRCGEDGLLLGSKSYTDEPRPPDIAHEKLKQTCLDSINDLGPVSCTHPIPPTRYIDMGAPKQGDGMEENYESINGQLPTPNATQLVEDVSKEKSLNPIAQVEQLLHPRSLVQFQEKSITTETDPVDENPGEGRDNCSEIASYSPVPTGLLETTSRAIGFQHTPVDSKDEYFESSPILIGDATPVSGYDASAELAMAALASPKRVQSKPIPSRNAIQDPSTRSLHTDLGEFTALSSLRYKLEKKLDILAIVTNYSPEPQRAKLGPYHFYIHFNVTDPSTAPSVTEIQIFRPYKEALPTVRSGDAVLLRNFQVMSERNRGFTLRSGNSSSWLIFKQYGKEEVPGPPVELGDGEREYMAQLQLWFNGLNVILEDKPENQSVGAE